MEGGLEGGGESSFKYLIFLQISFSSQSPGHKGLTNIQGVPHQVRPRQNYDLGDKSGNLRRVNHF